MKAFLKNYMEIKLKHIMLVLLYPGILFFLNRKAFESGFAYMVLFISFFMLYTSSSKMFMLKKEGNLKESMIYLCKYIIFDAFFIGIILVLSKICFSISINANMKVLLFVYLSGYLVHFVFAYLAAFIGGKVKLQAQIFLFSNELFSLFFGCILFPCRSSIFGICSILTYVFPFSIYNNYLYNCISKGTFDLKIDVFIKMGIVFFVIYFGGKMIDILRMGHYGNKKLNKQR